MTEALLLQATRLKGRLTASAAASCAGISIVEARAGLDELVAAGHATTTGASTRLTPQGRERLIALLDEERRRIDQAALERIYGRFDELNTNLKSIVTAWQIRDDQVPNDHSDEGYDHGVVERLLALHERFAPLLEQVVAQAPRLDPYRDRFDNAVHRLRAGDHSFVARPIADSYHTVWFELHEELIALLGRTRAAEAAAGRAL